MFDSHLTNSVIIGLIVTGCLYWFDSYKSKKNQEIINRNYIVIGLGLTFIIYGFLVFNKSAISTIKNDSSSLEEVLSETQKGTPDF